MAEVNNKAIEPEVKINHFYIAHGNNPQAKTRFSVEANETIPSFSFEFRIGVLRRNITSPIRIKINMKNSNYFIDLPLEEGTQLALNDGWVGSEYIITSQLTNMEPGQTGTYIAHIFMGEVELASAETTLFIVEDE